MLSTVGRERQSRHIRTMFVQSKRDNLVLHHTEDCAIYCYRFIKN
jgi:hypothetical protein